VSRPQADRAEEEGTADYEEDQEAGKESGAQASTREHKTAGPQAGATSAGSRRS
jgi:hypothetical protein